MSETVKISNITVPSGRRKLRPDKVDSLAISISEVGLINPITISSDHKLIAGQHRLEAMKINGAKEIECRIADISFDDDDRVIIEYSENEERVDFTRSEKLALYNEVMRVRDQRKNNGGNDTRKIDSSPIQEESILSNNG